MDAGDEFRCDKSKKELFKIINDIPAQYNFGLVRQQWLDSSVGLSEHCDVRLVRNHQNCKYDIRYPVHEKFKNVSGYVDLSKLFCLYQDRIKYGGNTEKRFEKDIHLLLNAFPCKRNYYFLAQSYMSINDFKNGFKYNVLSIEKNDDEDMDTDQKFTYVRAGFCAMKCNLPPQIIFQYLSKAIEFDEPPIDAFIYIFKYCIENNCQERAVPYIKKLADLKKPTDNIQLVNHEFYDYTRWHLISVLCLMTRKDLIIGKLSCRKAIAAKNRPDDINNLKLFS
jgi:hypothetical protein